MMERFVLQHSSESGWWVCTDPENGVVCRFEDHRLNDTQRFTILEDAERPDALTMARIVREMADWLRENHYDKIF